MDFGQEICVAGLGGGADVVQWEEEAIELQDPEESSLVFIKFLFKFSCHPGGQKGSSLSES